MIFALTSSVIAPLVGLVALLLVAGFPRLHPYKRFVVPASAGFSFIAVLFAPLEPVQTVVLFHWQPSIFVGVSPAFVAEPRLWFLALAFSGAVAASALVQLGRIAEPRFPLDGSVLGMLAAGLAGLWAANPLTLLLAWAGFDLSWGLGAVAGGFRLRRVAWGAGLGGLAVLALWAGALVAGEHGSAVSWDLMNLSGPGGVLLLVAGFLRLGLYPCHLTLPEERGRPLPAVAPLLLGGTLGWWLLARVTMSGGAALLAAPWLEAVAVASFVGGGVLAWTRPGSAAGWPWIGLAALGALLWAGLRTGDGVATVMVAGGAAWALGATLLCLDRGLERGAPWWSVAPAVGGLTLVGAPATLGWVPMTQLLRSLSPLTPWRTVAFVVGYGLLVAGVARRLLRRAVVEEPVGSLLAAARVAGLALPALLLLGAGLFPTHLLSDAGLGALSRPGLLGWGLWLAGLIVGVALFWVGRRYRERLGALLGLVHDLVRLEWLLRLVLESMERLIAFLGALADVMEGPGAILWALAIFLLVLRVIVGR